MRTVAICWEDGRGSGAIAVTNGVCAGVTLAHGAGTAAGTQFSLGGGACRLAVTIDAEAEGWGANPTFVAVQTERHSFTFLLRDVQRATPMWVPAYGVAVTERWSSGRPPARRG